MILLGTGWVLLGLFLLSGSYYKKRSGIASTSFLSPIAWEDHLQVFKGAVSCSLSSEELLERKAYLKKLIMSRVDRKEVQENSYVFYFKDDPKLLQNIMEFVQKEKACCPFFKFDLSILPFEKGLALQVSGSDEAFEMIRELDEELN